MLPQKRRKLRCRKNAAKFNKVSCLRHFCGAYKWQKNKKSQNPFIMLLGYTKLFCKCNFIYVSQRMADLLSRLEGADSSGSGGGDNTGSGNRLAI